MYMIKLQLAFSLVIQTASSFFNHLVPFPIAILKEEKVVWIARLALALISENFGVGQILFGWDENFLKTFILGQNFSEIFCPRTKNFISWDKNFLKIFILGHFFSGTKIPVTGHTHLHPRLH